MLFQLFFTVVSTDLLINIIFSALFFNSLAGSADRTVKFWDLETFELIGSAGPEVFLFLCH